jgi:hypothetical protein
MSLLDGFVQESGLAVFERYLFLALNVGSQWKKCFIDYITFTGGGVDPPYFAA